MASARVLGSVLTARWIGRGRVAEMLLGGNFVMGIALIALAVTVELPVQVAVAFVAGIVQSVVLVTYLTLRTVHSPDELLGRVGSTARTISLGLQPVGLLIGGALIDLTSGSIDDGADGRRGRGRQPALRPDRGDPQRHPGS